MNIEVHSIEEIERNFAVEAAPSEDGDGARAVNFSPGGLEMVSPSGLGMVCNI